MPFANDLKQIDPTKKIIDKFSVYSEILSTARAMIASS
jgi:hypothetical protein